MNNIIKQIRLTLGMSQEKLANLLGISPITVSRWENQKAKPSQIAQKQLYQLCKEHNLDLADFIVKEIQVEQSGSKVILYHGSRQGITDKIQPISREKCDFGKGFYMGTVMNKSLQNALSDMQGKLFELSGEHGYDSDTFIRVFMTSKVAAGLDSDFDYMQWAGKEYILERLEDEYADLLKKGGTIFLIGM